MRLPIDATSRKYGRREYGSFVCDVCGKPGTKVQPRQKRHVGECGRVHALRRFRSWLHDHNQKEKPGPIRKDLWSDELLECDRLIAAGLGDRPQWEMPRVWHGRKALIEMARGYQDASGSAIQPRGGVYRP